MLESRRPFVYWVIDPNSNKKTTIERDPITKKEKVLSSGPIPEYYEKEQVY